MRPRSAVSAIFVLVVAATFSRFAAARADPPTAVVVELDGETIRTEGYAIDGTDAIGPADLVWVGKRGHGRGHLLVRGPEPVLRYREDGDRLFQRLQDGREVLVAFRASLPAPVMSASVVQPRPAGRVAPATPFGLTTGEIAGLRGLCIDTDTSDLDRLLATINLTNVPVVVDEHARSAIAKLPISTRYLVVDGGRDDRGFVDPLPALPGLRLLDLRDAIPLASEDVKAIARSTDLRWLAIHGRAWGLAPLQALRALRVLDLDGVVTGPSLDLSFAASLSSLREIRLKNTRARDLTPLGGLAELESITARGAPIMVLPTGTLPALRHLDVIDTLVPPERAAAFARVRPACAVDRTYRDVLLRGVGTVDAVRVRSGGTCHRNESEEKVHATITEPLQVAAILASLEFSDGPVWSCMCCGEPTIELLRGGKVVASLGIHHGVSLRWPGGDWSGDAVLEVESRIRLFTLLTAAGVPGIPPPSPPEPTERAGWARRMAREQELLPKDVLHVLGRLEDVAWQDSMQGAIAEVVEVAIAPGADRIETCLRLLPQCGFAWFGAFAALRRRSDEAVLAHIRAGLEDPELARGAGFWLLRRLRSQEESATLPQDALVDRILGAMLGDADPDVRLYAIEGLARRGGEIAVRWNRRVLEGFVLTSNPDPKAPKIAETAENRRAAISTALALRDAESLPRIRELVAAEDDAHRETLEHEIDKTFPKPK